MSRAIKFRAWHKGDEQMLTVNCIDWTATLTNGKTGYIAHDEKREEVAEYIEGYPRYEGTWASDLDDVILMQFTGLNDKNGVEIYEGDIVRTAIGMLDPGGTIYENREVKVDPFFGLNGMLDPDDVEVIGNVHQNPELLGGANANN